VGCRGRGHVRRLQFTVLVVLIVFSDDTHSPRSGIRGIRSGFLIYCIVTSLLAWGSYRAKSFAWASVMLLAGGARVHRLVGGVFHSSYDGAPRSDGPSGDWLAGLITDVRKEKKLVALPRW